MRLAGIEPATTCSVGKCSIQLSYRRILNAHLRNTTEAQGAQSLKLAVILTTSLSPAVGGSAFGGN